MCIKINRKVTFFIQYSRTKKSKYCCHPPFHPPIFCHHSLKLLSPTLPKLMNWILLSPPPLSSDPDNPPKFVTCTRVKVTFHLTISMRGQPATGKIQRNNYHHGSCGPSLTGKTMSVFLIFTQGRHRNVKNR